jgi:hypothetical protein
MRLPNYLEDPEGPVALSKIRSPNSINARSKVNQVISVEILHCETFDPRDNKLVKISGEVMGTDGAAGLAGKRLGVDRNALKKAFRKVASSGLQVAGMMASALGRGPVIIDGAGYRLATPLTDQARNAKARYSTLLCRSLLKMVVV